MPFHSDNVFAEIKKHLTPEQCDEVGVVFQFDLTNAAGEKKSYVLDLKNKPGSVKEGATSSDATCTIVISDDDFPKLITGELNGMQAFMSKRMSIKGNMMQAQKLSKLKPAQSKL